MKEKLKLANSTEAGDIWRSIKTGRTATVLENNPIRGIYLKHETGYVGYIQQQCLARDYIPTSHLK